MVTFITHVISGTYCQGSGGCQARGSLCKYKTKADVYLSTAADLMVVVPLTTVWQHELCVPA